MSRETAITASIPLCIGSDEPSGNRSKLNGFLSRRNTASHRYYTRHRALPLVRHGLTVDAVITLLSKKNLRQLTGRLRKSRRSFSKIYNACMKNYLPAAYAMFQNCSSWRLHVRKIPQSLELSCAVIPSLRLSTISMSCWFVRR